MGEVIVDKEDVFGDVVNIAARLESFAAPGSGKLIWIGSSFHGPF